MSSIQIKSSVSLEELIRGVTQLEGEELDAFIQQILTIRARRNAPNLEARESELLEQINQGLPAPSRERWEELEAKRRAERLSEEEQTELIELSNALEALNVQRLQYLSELAPLRQTDLRTLMKELGIAPLDD